MREDSSAFHGAMILTQAAFINRCIATILAHYQAFYEYRRTGGRVDSRFRSSAHHSPNERQQDEGNGLLLFYF
jgi:hypothetical protein